MLNLRNWAFLSLTRIPNSSTFQLINVIDLLLRVALHAHQANVLKYLGFDRDTCKSKPMTQNYMYIGCILIIAFFQLMQ
ncbi:hypothetical protein DN393_24610 [Bacillus sp. BPN334]|nr:hypothetical protein DN393_24610 [Bacillus sp. BPN334]